jgi:hypothetical protein
VSRRQVPLRARRRWRPPGCSCPAGVPLAVRRGVGVSSSGGAACPPRWASRWVQLRGRRPAGCPARGRRLVVRCAACPPRWASRWLDRLTNQRRGYGYSGLLLRHTFRHVSTNDEAAVKTGPMNAVPSSDVPPCETRSNPSLNESANASASRTQPERQPECQPQRQPERQPQRQREREPDANRCGTEEHRDGMVSFLPFRSKHFASRVDACSAA